MVRVYLDEQLGDLVSPLLGSGHDVVFGAGILTAASEPGFSQSTWTRRLESKLAESGLEGRLFRWVESTGKWYEARWRPDKD